MRADRLYLLSSQQEIKKVAEVILANLEVIDAQIEEHGAFCIVTVGTAVMTVIEDQELNCWYEPELSHDAVQAIITLHRRKSWKIKAIEEILDCDAKQVEDKRFYLSSKVYGDSRYHLIDKRHNGVQIEQLNIDEKWGSRTFLQEDEIKPFLKVLLQWYIDDATDDSLSDLDDHPF